MATNGIINAIRTNNIPQVTSLIYSCIDINAKDSHNRIPLIFAIQHKNIEIIKLLLNHKDIDVNVKDNDGYTPLMAAVQQHNTEIVKLLLNHKNIDVNIQNRNGYTPLMVAVQQKNIEIIKLLLNHKNIDVNIQSRDGSTPLHYINGLDTKAVEQLLSYKNIDINVQNNNGDTPLHNNIYYIGNLRLLLNHKDININIRNNRGETPLHKVVDHNDKMENIELLLNHKDTNINIQSNDGDTPLMRFFNRYYRLFKSCDCVNNKSIINNMKNIIKIIKLFLSRNEIDINIQNNKNDTPLLLAVKCYLLNIVKILFEKGVEFNYNNILENPSYIKAISNNHIEIVTYMKKMFENHNNSHLNTLGKFDHNIRDTLNINEELACLLKGYNILEFKTNITILQDNNINEIIIFDISNTDNIFKCKLISLLKKYKIFNFEIINKIEDNIVKQIVNINI